jgi:hypothetical protein
MRTATEYPEGESEEMNDKIKDRNRKLAMLGGLGLGLALLKRGRRFRRYGMGPMFGPGFGHGHWGRFGGYGPSAYGQEGVQLPPFIEATLKAWHDRAHGNVPPAAPRAEEPTTQV